MPTPIEVLLDPVSLAVVALYAALITWEALAPARALPRIKAWKTKGLLAFLTYMMVSAYFPLMWTEHLAQFQILDLTRLGTWGGALAGLLVYEAGAYAWHRSMHGSNILWRALHQMHHSAERIDTYGAFWFSPLDMIGWTLLPSLALVLVVGITPEATTLTLLAVSFLGIFQHTNVRTPRWLGYIVQRPQSHSHHHERGVHARNYADLPLFDLMFGTFHNPPGFASETGFYHGASARVTEMLSLRDVSNPVAAAPV